MLHTIEKRIREADPVVIDTAIAVALAAMTCLSIWLFSEMAPDFLGSPHGAGDGPPFKPERAFWEPRLAPGARDYLLAIACFLPLAVRRRFPWAAFVLTGIAAIAYGSQPAPPTFTFLGPMIALFTLAANAKRRLTGLLALVVTGVVISPAIITLSANFAGVRDVVTAFVLLAASAILGEAERSRRAYVAEVEQRALDAERTREEEALRRVDEERLRIAREVHDTVAHSLSIVTVQAAAAEALLDEDPERARESIRHIRRTGKNALADLRSVLTILRTSDGQAPLAPTAGLDDVAELAETARQAGLTVNLTTAGDFSAVPASAAVSAYRVVQESLTNVVRHAGASTVDMAVKVDASRVTVSVTDDGAGPSGGETGLGIKGMRERVEALGGHFEAGPSSEGGFRVHAVIPLSGGAS